MNSLIRLENISKTYPMGEVKVKALQEINLEIAKGGLIAIAGPSGSGKSTLMHIIGLLDRPTSGRVVLRNRDVSKLSTDKRANLRNKHIGFVFQTFNLLPKTSALDNVALPLIYSGVKRSERVKRAKKVLGKVGLAERVHHLPSQLSGGEQQRVAIARSLVNNPSLMLADEPTGNLDSKTGDEIINLLIDLNKSGNTIVIVTHERKIANKARRVVKLKDGRIING